VDLERSLELLDRARHHSMGRDGEVNLEPFDHRSVRSMPTWLTSHLWQLIYRAGACRKREGGNSSPWEELTRTHARQTSGSGCQEADFAAGGPLPEDWAGVVTGQMAGQTLAVVGAHRTSFHRRRIDDRSPQLLTNENVLH
jgi:hypothetical protein